MEKKDGEFDLTKIMSPESHQTNGGRPVDDGTNAFHDKPW